MSLWNLKVNTRLLAAAIWLFLVILLAYGAGITGLGRDQLVWLGQVARLLQTPLLTWTCVYLLSGPLPYIAWGSERIAQLQKARRQAEHDYDRCCAASRCDWEPPFEFEQEGQLKRLHDWYRWGPATLASLSASLAFAV